MLREGSERTLMALPDLPEIDVHPDQEQLFAPPPRISSVQLCELADVSYRQVDYWCRTELLRPVVEARGSGSQRQFDEAEIAVARAVRALLPFWTDRFDTRGQGRGPYGPRRDVELLALLERIRHGEREMVEVERGIWFDLEVLCSP